MIQFRDEASAAAGCKLIVHINQDGLARGVDPFSCSSSLYTQVMKTDALKQALAQYEFDAAIGGARRDEERSRAKERIFSFRPDGQAWDPKNQRPELWRVYNCRLSAGESCRVFPLSNWTELDIWRYVELEQIHVVPLYFAADRPVVDRAGSWIVVEDERFPLNPGERLERRRVRFRTLGCYPLTAAIESDAATVPDIIREIDDTRRSERHGRLIDRDVADSMEKKKREGYF